MSKKDTHQATEFVPESIRETPPPADPAPLYESEAYGSPQPDKGSEITVTKTVGLGGPVPIVAPKHNTIQLQPIIVPLAVVPYMTQDSDVLRTDGRRADKFAGGGATVFGDIDVLSADEKASEKRRRGSAGAFPRLAAAFIALLSAALAAGFLLAYFKPDLGGRVNFAGLNVIGMIKAWAAGAEPVNMLTAILYIISAGFAALTFVTSLICLISGRYPGGFLCVSAFLIAGPLSAVIIYEVVKNEFVADAEIALILMLSLALAVLLLAAVFAAVKARLDDRDEETAAAPRSEHEI